MLKRMKSKSIQNSWCYRYKLLSLWISSIDILGFLTFTVFWKCVLRIRMYRSGVGGKAKAYFLVQGWVGGSIKAILGRTYFIDAPTSNLHRVSWHLKLVISPVWMMKIVNLLDRWFKLERNFLILSLDFWFQAFH